MVVAAIITPILQMGKLRHRLVHWLTHSHVAFKHTQSISRVFNHCVLCPHKERKT